AFHGVFGVWAAAGHGGRYAGRRLCAASRHGYRTAAQVRADQRRLDQDAVDDTVGRLSRLSHVSKPGRRTSCYCVNVDLREKEMSAFLSFRCLVTAKLLAVVLLAAAPIDASRAANGTRLLINGKTGKCLTIAGGTSPANNLMAVQFDCDGDLSR